MRLTWATTLVALLLTSTPILAADIHCDKSTPCEIGCCGTNNVCGTGPDYCSKAKCINNCDFKAECNPGNWPSQYFNATKCPLNVCCSKYGFCGTTEEFCGKETVKRPSCNIGSQSVKRVIGYYGSGGASRECNAMLPSSFPQGIYTHIYFAFGSIDPKTFKVVAANKADEALYPRLAALKLRDRGQELWLSIGGWTFSDNGSPTATTFSDLVNADETRQRVFFASLTLFMQTWGFSGIDIDWEYPVDHDRNGRESDFKAYPRFLKRLKSALNDYKYGLSVTLPTSYWYLQHFDLENIEPSVDWFNVMSYDLHGAWDIGNKWTGAYVGAHSNLTEIKSSLDLLWRNKVSPSKVVLGLAFYGRAVTLASPSCSEPGCPYLSAADPGSCSGEAGILFNSEITDLISEKKLRPKLYKDAAVKTVQWNNDQWVSYDDRDTWKLKANFLKSQCLSGVLVWAVDYDDYKHSYSKGLAAALGIKINVDSGTGLEIKLPSKKDSSNDFCYFTNCGQTCPSGYTEIVRGDDTSQIMLDSTQCLDGSAETQTLCCPKSSKVPQCQWRGHSNSGHCTIGCNSGEVEIATLATGCKHSGWQSACCEATESTEPWSKCKWTDLCFDDDTCPSGYSSLVAKSREGWSGRRSCKNGKQYNYCCSETPKAFKSCKWVGNAVKLLNEKYCSDACPHGSTRIAEQQVYTLFNGNKPANSMDCVDGAEAYCCAGDYESDEDEQPTIVYRDETAREFDRLLQKFLSDPVCPEEIQSQFGFEGGMSRRDLGKRATDQTAVLHELVPIMETWLTSNSPRADMEDVWQGNLQRFELQSTAANVSTYTDLLYPGGWNGLPVYNPTLVIVETLCNLGGSRDALNGMALASQALCEIPSDDTGPGSDKRHLLVPRRLDGFTKEDRSANKVEPSIINAIRGARTGQLSLHYMRWLRSRGPNNAPPTQVLLEMAFWIGPEPGVDPGQAFRDVYSDRTHTAMPDRWIIFHFHIPLNSQTFYVGGQRWLLGVDTFSMYHSHDIRRPAPVDSGTGPDYRAEFA
ncbi:Chitinase [Fusarium acuminatum]|uniref:chitinase n=1 Tax=Fusarium acuminatum TaxID=5515 RepID=A0ABZ2WNT0_9HYPO